MRLPIWIAVAAFASAAPAALLGACATNEDTELTPPSDTNEVPHQDAAAEAAEDGQVKPCADCDHFPTVCSDDVLCAVAPFDPLNPASLIDSRAAILDVRGRGPNDVWLAGAVGVAAHFDGATWRTSDLGVSETQTALVLLDSSELAFRTWNSYLSRGASAGVADAGPSRDGWSVQPLPAAPPNWNLSGAMLTAVWAAGEDELWVGGDGGRVACGLWRLRRTAFSTFTLSESMPTSTCLTGGFTEIHGLHGASPDALWAVGGRGAAVRIEGAAGANPTLRAYNSLTVNALRGVWAASDSEAWAVGAAGTIRHYNGDPVFWEVIDDVPTNETLNGVWGTSASDIWAVGNAGVVLHYDGARWIRMKVAGLAELRPDLYSVWSPAPGHVWIGGRGVLLSLGGKP